MPEGRQGPRKGGGARGFGTGAEEIWPGPVCGLGESHYMRAWAGRWTTHYYVAGIH